MTQALQRRELVCCLLCGWTLEASAHRCVEQQLASIAGSQLSSERARAQKREARLAHELVLQLRRQAQAALHELVQDGALTSATLRGLEDTYKALGRVEGLSALLSRLEELVGGVIDQLNSPAGPTVRSAAALGLLATAPL